MLIVKTFAMELRLLQGFPNIGNYRGVNDLSFKNIDYESLLGKMKGKRISSRKLINVLFLALKNMDAPLIYDLATEDLQRKFGPREDFYRNGLILWKNTPLLRLSLELV